MFLNFFTNSHRTRIYYSLKTDSPVTGRTCPFHKLVMRFFLHLIVIRGLPGVYCPHTDRQCLDLPWHRSNALPLCSRSGSAVAAWKHWHFAFQLSAAQHHHITHHPLPTSPHLFLQESFLPDRKLFADQCNGPQFAPLLHRIKTHPVP